MRPITHSAVKFQCQFASVSGSFGTEATFRVLCDGSGSGSVVKVGYPAGLAGGLMLMVGNGEQWGNDTSSWLQQVAMAALDGTGATWYTATVEMSKEPSGTYTLTAKIYNGATLLAEATATSSFKTGGFCGVEMVTASDEFYTHYDNFDVTGSGATQVITQIATSYVFTYVDDFSQESAPGPASVTILRPAGVQVAVTTPTDLPSGVSTDYGIATKRIYRAAKGEVPEGDYVVEIVTEVFERRRELRGMKTTWAPPVRRRRPARRAPSWWPVRPESARRRKESREPGH